MDYLCQLITLVIIWQDATIAKQCFRRSSFLGKAQDETGMMTKGEKVCIEVILKEESWKAAESHCNSKFSGNLVSIHSLEDMLVIQQYATGVIGSTVISDSSCWIGLRDPICPHDKNATVHNQWFWRWSDDSPVDYTRWANAKGFSEPNGPGRQCCGQAYLKPSTNTHHQERLDSRFNDHTCDTKSCFVCQYYPERDANSDPNNQQKSTATDASPYKIIAGLLATLICMFAVLIFAGCIQIQNVQGRTGQIVSTLRNITTSPYQIKHTSLSNKTDDNSDLGLTVENQSYEKSEN